MTESAIFCFVNAASAAIAGGKFMAQNPFESDFIISYSIIDKLNF